MQLTEEIIRRIARQEARKVTSTYIFNGIGGSSEIPSLEGLEDTTITDPQDDDIIVYDDATEKWINEKKSIPWTKVTNPTTSSGRDFNVLDGDTTDNILFINSHKRDGSNLTNPTTDIYFYNGQGTPNGVTVHAQNFLAKGSVTALSDERLKDILHPVGIRIEDIAKAPIVVFRWKDDDGQEHIGSIAQYWQKIVPELTPEDKDGHLSMDYATIALISAVSLARKVEELERRIAELEKKTDGIR